MKTERNGRRAWSAALCLLGTGILVWAVLVLLQVQPAWALDCPQATKFYNNWESERIYEDPSVFAGYSRLAWGTEVCPQQETAEHWQRTWNRIRLPNGLDGWVAADDLITQAAFAESLRDRHAARIAELAALLVEVRELETRLQDLGITAPLPDLHTVILAWVEASPGKMGTPAIAQPEAVSEPKPTPTVVPRSTPTPTPEPVAVDPCTTAEVEQYQAEMLDVLISAAETAAGLEQQFARVGEDTTLFFDDDWRFETALWLGFLLGIQPQLEAMSVPPIMQQGHNFMLTAGSYYSRSAREYARALDNVDTEGMLRGNELILEGNAFANKANTAYLEACD